MMFGGTANIKLLAALSASVVIVLALDKYYWLLYPILGVTGIALPGLPFSASELGMILVLGMYCIRHALHKERAFKIRLDTLVVFPVFVWICMIWVLNPTGIAMFGSDSIGARFYIKIVLGFLMLLMLSSLRFSEKDCRILFRCLFVCTVYAFVKSILTAKFTRIQMGDDFEEVSSNYQLLNAMSLYALTFSRYGFSQVFQSIGRFSFVLVCAALTVYSGKRRGLGTLFLIPLLRVFFTGRDKAATLCWGLFGAFVVFIAVAGHGSLWELPQAAQRSLSVVVPSFQTSSAMGMKDIFRQEVHRYAKEVIRENPWFGRKGYAMSRNETAWILQAQARGAEVFEGHAYAGNWHSVWYAFACDFGLPALFFWVLFLLYALTYIIQGFRRCRFELYSLSVYLYYSYLLFLGVIFSSTSGHSSFAAMSTWGIYGMILAVRNGYEEKAEMQRVTAA